MISGQATLGFYFRKSLLPHLYLCLSLEILHARNSSKKLIMNVFLVTTRDKNIYNVREVGMAKKPHKQVFGCTYQPARALVKPTLFVYCVEPIPHTWILSIR